VALADQAEGALMWHPFPGFAAVVIGALSFGVIFLLAYREHKSSGSFKLDPPGKAGGYEPFLAKYLRLGEFVIGLATGSIVLLVGSSALHGQSGHLPWVYATPLLLLGCSVLYGVLFMVWLIYDYEMYQHGTPHTRSGYALSEALGFSSLLCFVSGYISLIIAVTR
jgi:hypothetical protein